MRRGAGQQTFDFVARRSDVARPDTGITANVLVEFGRAVILPEPAENQPYGSRLTCFRGALIGTTRECFVDFFGVRGRELVRLDAARNCNDGFGRAAIFPFPIADERGEKEPGNRIPLACDFGRVSSFCSASNWRAARRLVKDLRSLLPDLSRQSA